MVLKIVIGLVVVIGIYVIYAVTQPTHYYWEHSALIKAPAEKIYPYLNQLKLAHNWSPYEKDLEMKKTFSGSDGEPGQKNEFGPGKSGEGSVTVLETVPNQRVKLRLQMSAPMAVDQIIHYKLTPEQGDTRFSWAMEGDFGFFGKLFSPLGKMFIASQMKTGFDNMQTLMAQPSSNASGEKQ